MVEKIQSGIKDCDWLTRAGLFQSVWTNRINSQPRKGRGERGVQGDGGVRGGWQDGGGGRKMNKEEEGVEE